MKERLEKAISTYVDETIRINKEFKEELTLIVKGLFRHKGFSLVKGEESPLRIATPLRTAIRDQCLQVNRPLDIDDLDELCYLTRWIKFLWPAEAYLLLGWTTKKTPRPIFVVDPFTLDEIDIDNHCWGYLSLTNGSQMEWIQEPQPGLKGPISRVVFNDLSAAFEEHRVEVIDLIGSLPRVSKN